MALRRQASRASCEVTPRWELLLPAPLRQSWGCRGPAGGNLPTSTRLRKLDNLWTRQGIAAGLSGLQRHSSWSVGSYSVDGAIQGQRCIKINDCNRHCQGERFKKHVVISRQCAQSVRAFSWGTHALPWDPLQLKNPAVPFIFFWNFWWSSWVGPSYESWALRAESCAHEGCPGAIVELHSAVETTI